MAFSSKNHHRIFFLLYTALAFGALFASLLTASSNLNVVFLKDSNSPAIEITTLGKRVKKDIENLILTNSTTMVSNKQTTLMASSKQTQNLMNNSLFTKTT